jgi:hypothetical protein
MLLIHGTYHWFPRRKAFRNDFCMACAEPRRAVLISTLDVLHIFWLPVIPLGRWRRWKCSQCGNPPHHSVKTRRGFKIAGALLLLVGGVIVWTVPDLPDEPGVWLARYGLPLASVVTVVHIAMSGPAEPGYRARKRTIEPANDKDCPFCGTALFCAPPDCFCPNCETWRL